MNNTPFDEIFPFGITEEASQAAQALVDWLSLWSSYIPTNEIEDIGRQIAGEERPLLMNAESEKSDMSYKSMSASNEVEVEKIAVVETEVREPCSEKIPEVVTDNNLFSELVVDDDIRVQIDEELRIHIDNKAHANVIDDLLTENTELKTRNDELSYANDMLYYALTRVLEKTRALELKARLYEERKCDAEWIETLAEDAKASYKKELKVFVNREEHYNNDEPIVSHGTKTVSP